MALLPKRPHAGPREDAAGKAGPCQSLTHGRDRKIRALGVRFGVYDGFGGLSPPSFGRVRGRGVSPSARAPLAPPTVAEGADRTHTTTRQNSCHLCMLSWRTMKAISAFRWLSVGFDLILQANSETTADSTSKCHGVTPGE